MTVAEMRRQLSKMPEEAEVIVRVGEDSRDNPVFEFVDGMFVSTVEQVDSEKVWMNFEEDAKVVVLSLER